MRIIKRAKLKEILEKHKLWLEGKGGGVRADLSFADLSFADLRYVDLRFADLRFADLRSADLSLTNLRSVEMFNGWKLIKDE